jgi:hypothetical protein
MDDDANGQQSDQLVQGGRSRWTRGRLVVAGVAVLLVLAAGFTGVAMAADGNRSSRAGVPAGPGAMGRHVFGAHGEGMGGPMGGWTGAAMGILGGPVRGEMVVPKAGGGYQTIHFQRGKVTSVSGSQITVKSADGVSATYAVSAKTRVNAERDGIDSIDQGAQVHVLAVGPSDSLRAVWVVDESALPWRMHRRLDRPGQPPASGAPDMPGTSGTSWLG